MTTSDTICIGEWWESNQVYEKHPSISYLYLYIYIIYIDNGKTTLAFLSRGLFRVFCEIASTLVTRLLSHDGLSMSFPLYRSKTENNSKKGSYIIYCHTSRHGHFAVHASVNDSLPCLIRSLFLNQKYRKHWLAALSKPKRTYFAQVFT